MAVEDWNRAHAEKGRCTFVLVKEDDKGDVETAKQVAQKLADAGVAGVVGHMDSSCSIAASDVYAQNDIVMITPASTNPAVTDRGLKNVFRLCGRDDQQGKAAAVHLMNSSVWMEEDKKPVVAVACDDTNYGKGLAAKFKRNYELLSNKAIVIEKEITRGTTDFEDLIRELKESKANFLYFGGVYDDAGPLLEALGEAGLELTFMSGDGCFSNRLIELAGADHAEGSFVTFPKAPQAGPELDAFRKAYTQKFGEEGSYSLYGYSAMMILLNSLEKGRGKLTGEYLAQDIRRSTHQTLFGDIRFGAAGDVTESPFYIWQVKDGAFVELGAPGI